MKFGSYLRQYRELIGYGLRQFANRIGVSATALSAVELNQREIPKSFPLYRAAEELGIKRGSDDWITFFDLAAQGDIPEDVRDELLRDRTWVERIRLEAMSKL